MIGVLKKKDVFKDIMNEINGYQSSASIEKRLEGMDIDGEVQNKGDGLDFYFGSSGPCILEEYQVKVEE